MIGNRNNFLYEVAQRSFKVGKNLTQTAVLIAELNNTYENPLSKDELDGIVRNAKLNEMRD